MADKVRSPLFIRISELTPHQKKAAVVLCIAGVSAMFLLVGLANAIYRHSGSFRYPGAVGVVEEPYKSVRGTLRLRSEHFALVPVSDASGADAAENLAEFLAPMSEIGFHHEVDSLGEIGVFTRRVGGPTKTIQQTRRVVRFHLIPPEGGGWTKNTGASWEFPLEIPNLSVSYAGAKEVCSEERPHFRVQSTEWMVPEPIKVLERVLPWVSHSWDVRFLREDGHTTALHYGLDELVAVKREGLGWRIFRESECLSGASGVFGLGVPIMASARGARPPVPIEESLIWITSGAVYGHELPNEPTTRWDY